MRGSPNGMVYWDSHCKIRVEHSQVGLTSAHGTCDMGEVVLLLMHALLSCRVTVIPTFLSPFFRTTTTTELLFLLHISV